MNAFAQFFAVAAGLVHVLFFTMESVVFTRPRVHARFGTGAADLEAVRPWAFNQGWYNLFLAAGAVGGVIAVHLGAAAAGRPIALFACGCMLGASAVLVGSNRQMWPAALVQGGLPLLALITAAL